MAQGNPASNGQRRRRRNGASSASPRTVRSDQSCPDCACLAVRDPITSGLYCGNVNCHRHKRREWVVCPPPAPSASQQEPSGAQLRDEALERVEAATDAQWLHAACGAVRRLAGAQASLTTDDVWAVLANATVGPPPEPRAMGAVMRRMALEGLIRSTNRTQLSARPECHRRPLTVWEVLR